MKKMLHKDLLLLMTVTILFCLIVNILSQVYNARQTMILSSSELFKDIQQTISSSQQELNEVKDDYNRKCLLQADAAAYMLLNNPELLYDREEIQNVIELLQIDELHFFTPDGTLISGSHPEYFGYTFYSGTQMNYFLPMLSDHTLKLCQSVQPNTAQRKMMQYAAVWTKDEQYIVQIGISPRRILDLTRKNELSYIFSILTPEDGHVLYAISPDTLQIRGATEPALIGRTIPASGIDRNTFVHHIGKGFSATIGGQRVYCYFEEAEGILLGISVKNSVLYRGLIHTTVNLLIFLLLLASILMTCILSYLDRKVIRSIDQINYTLSQITAGDLSKQVNVDTTPEFKQLSLYICGMIDGILSSADRLAYVLEQFEMPFGAFEYSFDSEQVIVTRQVAHILALSQDEAEKIFASRVLFISKIADIKQHPVRESEDVYKIPGKERFVRLTTRLHKTSVLGSVSDVTKEMIEKYGLIRERDEDSLTGLLNRRSFIRQAEEIIANPQACGFAVLIMIDCDNLKEINDHYGHNYGDLYLRKTAECLISCSAENKLSARIGGDEFVMLLFGCNCRQQAENYALALRCTGEKFSFAVERKSLNVSFSLGYVCIPDNCTDSLSSLFFQADQSMYAEKQKHHAKQNTLENCIASDTISKGEESSCKTERCEP